jgi:hypothetical protein
MAVDTFSIATTGYNANSPSAAKPLILGDATGAQPGLQQSALQTGGYVWCKGPDGAQGYYQIDPYRSIPGGPIYLLATRP